MDDLLRAVIENPDDDAPRFVYADRLQQAGDPRGEYIALALAKSPEADALLAKHRDEWTARLPYATQAWFTRGFVGGVKLNVNPDERTTPLLAALDLEPIASVAFVNDGHDIEDFEDVARWLTTDPRTARIVDFNLSWMDWGETAFPQLFEADLPKMRELRISDGDCNHAMPTISKLHDLEMLGFYGDYAADLDDEMPALAAARLTKLRHLDLECVGLTEKGAIALASSPHLRNLRELSFSGGSYQANKIGTEGALALCAFTTLERLAVVGNEVGDDFLLRLAENSLPALQSLAINSCPIGANAVAAFARSPRFVTMRELWVGGCPGVGDEGAIALATSPHNRSLKMVNLHGCGIGVDGARALAKHLGGRLDYISINLTPETEAILRPAFGDALNRKA